MIRVPMPQPRVLLVEDDEGLRYAMRVALERAGIDVDEATDGKAAIDAINNNPDAYRCVVLDMLLPLVHGSSVLAHVARTAPHIPIVSVTGFPDRVLFADPSHRHVVKAIFTKPVDPVDVAAYVKSRCREQ
jgi:DNA-binding NtrC family response regulator